MDAVADSSSVAASPEPAWKLRWLTPGVCRVLFVALLAFDFVSHYRYLTVDCPIDLSGDEAQYWDWSRNLDLSYYSKGPLIAYIIRTSCAVFGDVMWAVRLPALVFGTCTLIVTYLLTRKLFKSDRVALGAVLLFHLAPVFVAGSVLMTIDPPFFLCWATATYLLAVALFDGKRWPWPMIGVVAGVGFLAKYAMFLWFVPMLLAMAVDARSRPLLRSRWPWLAVGVSLLFTTQVIVWNARNGWVSAQHVGTQTGASGGTFVPANLLELIGGQIGILGGVAALMIGGAVYAFRAGKRGEPFAREMRFLAVIGLTFFAFTFVTALRAKVQMNWPAPAYFTLTILAAYFVSTRLASRVLWKPWRPWVYFTVGFGLLMLPIAHDPGVLYPAVNWLNGKMAWAKQQWGDNKGFRGSIAKRIPADGISGQQVDFAYKLKGWEEIGQVLSKELRDLGPGAFALCHDYQQASALAFYLEGQPPTYYAASWYKDPDERGRMTQLDLWPNRDLSARSDNPLIGKNAVFLGRHDKPPSDLLAAFERVEGELIWKDRQIDGQWVKRQEVRRIVVPITRDGLTVREFRYFRCYGFKGMTRAEGPTKR